MSAPTVVTQASGSAPAPEAAPQSVTGTKRKRDDAGVSVNADTPAIAHATAPLPPGAGSGAGAGSGGGIAPNGGDRAAAGTNPSPRPRKVQATAANGVGAAGLGFAATAAAAVGAAAPPESGAGAGRCMPETTMSAMREAGQEERVPGCWFDKGTGLEYRVISNDGKPQHLRWLIRVKNIFSRQLPKMPKEYIVRLVLDRKHRCLVSLRGDKVVGGICFRPFLDQGFAEIVFLAITSTEQVKGYGTRLMNQLKETVKPMGITHFLTYADNYAIGYFKKQGFTKTVTMARSRWVGYIKEYDGGTLMECVLYTGINYLRIREIIAAHRDVVVNLLLKRTKANIVYPPLDFSKGPVSPVDIDGLEQAGWPKSALVLRRSRRDASPALNNAMRTLLKSIQTHSDAWPFEIAVDTTKVPDYLDVVKNPVDLSLIATRLESGTYYKSLEMFGDELMLMLNNCRLYNNAGTSYHKAATRLEQFVLRKLRQAAESLQEAGHS